jgi:PTH1 family peptidyl-tRNA hydrolase
MIVDSLGSEFNWRSSNRFNGDFALGDIGKQPVILLKPQTYMNLSGRSAVPLAHFYRVPPERIIVIHDEVDLDLGRLKVKVGGGDGGHNGIRSIQHELGDTDFFRIRVGVGRPEYGEIADHVLKDFRTEEMDLLEKEISRAAKATRTLLRSGLKETMNRFNRAPKPKRTKATELEGTKVDEDGSKAEQIEKPQTT